MIWTLEIKLLSGRWATKPWQATVALRAATTLEDLAYFIRRTLDFDDDHMETFYLARTPWSHARYGARLGGGRFSPTLESLYPLPKSQKLFYLFDFGDNWIFQITRTRKKPFAPESGGDYPRLISEIGERPDQYPKLDFSMLLEPE
jgi:hypothetical protein